MSDVNAPVKWVVAHKEHLTGVYPSVSQSLSDLAKASKMQSAVDIRFLPCLTLEDTLAKRPTIIHPDLEFMVPTVAPTCGTYSPGDVPKCGVLCLSTSIKWRIVTCKISSSDVVAGVSLSLAAAFETKGEH